MDTRKTSLQITYKTSKTNTCLLQDGCSNYHIILTEMRSARQKVLW
jgi:hypothetical protein